jgi:hypothetical protein
MEELIQKFKAVSVNEKVISLQNKTQKTLSTQASWSNREEEWYILNKLLLFATQSTAAVDTWVTKLNALIRGFETPTRRSETAQGGIVHINDSTFADPMISAKESQADNQYGETNN